MADATRVLFNIKKYRKGELRAGQYGLPLQLYDVENQLGANKSWPYILAKKNAVGVARTPLRLYVTKQRRQRVKGHATREVHDQDALYQRDKAHLQKYVNKAEVIEEVTRHPLLTLIENINPYMNQFYLWKLTQTVLDLTGNYYWYVEKNKQGTPIEIWPLSPQYVQIIPDANKFIRGYLFVKDGVKIPLDKENVIHFKEVNPQSLYYGLSPLYAVANAVNINIDVHVYMTSLFKNMGRPDVAIISDEVIGDTEWEKYKFELNQQYGGKENVGKIMFLSGGGKIEKFNWTPQELGVIGVSEWNLIELANALDVPMSKIATKDVNKANAEAGEYQHGKDGILPRCISLEQKLNEQLVPMFKDTKGAIFFAFDNPVPEDRKARNEEKNMNMKWGETTRNEERKRDRLQPVEGGDEIFVPFNYKPLSQALKEPEAPTANGGKPPSIPEHEPKVFVDEEGESLFLTEVSPVKEHDEDAGLKKNFSDEELAARDELWKVFVKRQGKFETEFTTTINELWAGQEKAILKRIKTAQKAYLKKDSAEDWVEAGKEEDERKFKQAWAALALVAMTAHGQTALDDLGLDIAFDATAPEVTELIASRSVQFAKEVNATTYNALESTLRQGIQAGEGIKKLRDRVKVTYDRWSGKTVPISKARAMLIARTETVLMANEGMVKAWQQAGTITHKEWVTAGDERVCEACIGMDGKIISIGDAYYKSGDQIDGRSDLTASYGDVITPPLHSNCRCTLLPVN